MCATQYNQLFPPDAQKLLWQQSIWWKKSWETQGCNGSYKVHTHLCRRAFNIHLPTRNQIYVSLYIFPHKAYHFTIIHVIHWLLCIFFPTFTAVSTPKESQQHLKTTSLTAKCFTMFVFDHSSKDCGVFRGMRIAADHCRLFIYRGKKTSNFSLAFSIVCLSEWSIINMTIYTDMFS